MAKEKIKFIDRDDLMKKLDAAKIVMKKADVNKEKLVSSLQNALMKVKRGDKHAALKVLELRKKMLSLASETYIELNEEQLFSTAVAELEIVEEIDDNE